VAGTFVSYQGLPGRRAVFRRSRGYTSDWSYVDIPVQAFKDQKFVLNLPQAGDGPDNFFSEFSSKDEKQGKGTGENKTEKKGAGNPQGPNDEDVDAGKAPRAISTEELPAELDHWGMLTLAEVDQDGKVFRTDATLYVARLETLIETFAIKEKKDAEGNIKQEAATGTLSLVRVHLVDVRFFWSRGLLGQWQFNIPVKVPGNPLAPQAQIGMYRHTLKKDGTPWTRAECAAYFLKCLIGKPALEAVPETWKTHFMENKEQFSLDLPPYCSAVEALRKLCQDAGVEDPCLRLDDVVEIREAGDGNLAPCKDVDGVPSGPNAKPKSTGEPFPVGVDGAMTQDKQVIQEQQAQWNRTPMDGYRLWKGGEGQGTMREPQYPEDVVVVVGAPYVASVALDDWEPVLLLSSDDLRYLPGADPHETISRVLPLNDETVRMMTSAGVGPNGAASPALGLAWLKLWICAAPENQHDQNVLPQVLEIFRTQAWRYYRIPQLYRIKDGLPGQNANLLPLQPRAETVGGKRLPVRVERFGFAPRHKEWDESSANLKHEQVKAKIAALQKEIADQAIKRGTAKPFHSHTRFDTFREIVTGKSSSNWELDASTFVRAARDAGAELTAPSYVWYVNDALNTARLLARIEEATTGAAAKAYENALRERYQIDALQNGGQPLEELLTLAQGLVRAEAEVTRLQKIKADKVLTGAAKGLAATGGGVVGAAGGALLGGPGGALAGGSLGASAGGAAAERVVGSEPYTALDAMKDNPVFLSQLGLMKSIDEKLREARRQLQIRRALHQDGSVSAARFGARVTYRNLPRAWDGRARVVDADLGIIETSGLAGHLAGQDFTPTPWDGRPFIPRPVRVTFGTEVAPFSDPTIFEDPEGNVVPPPKKQATGPGAGVKSPEDLLGEAEKSGGDKPPALSPRGSFAEEFWKQAMEPGDKAIEETKLEKEKAEADTEAFRKQALGAEEGLKKLGWMPGLPQRVIDDTGGDKNKGLDQYGKPVEGSLDALKQQIEGTIKAPGVTEAPDLTRIGIFGNQNVFAPKCLAQFQKHFWQAWKVKSRNATTGDVEMELLDRDLTQQEGWNAVVVYKPELEALISLGKEKPDELVRLTRQTRETAIKLFRRQEMLKGGRHLFARPWPINCDGRISFVEVRSVDHEGAPCGCETLVLEGSTSFTVRGKGVPITRVATGA
jgi:hypothetical protein